MELNYSDFAWLTVYSQIMVKLNFICCFKGAALARGVDGAAAVLADGAEAVITIITTTMTARRLAVRILM